MSPGPTIRTITLPSGLSVRVRLGRTRYRRQRDRYPRVRRPRTCQLTGCSERPRVAIVWAHTPRPLSTMGECIAKPANVWPGVTILWVCTAHAAVIGATVRNLGYGASVCVGGVLACDADWPAEPLSPDDLRRLLQAALPYGQASHA